MSGPEHIMTSTVVKPTGYGLCFEPSLLGHSTEFRLPTAGPVSSSFPSTALAAHNPFRSFCQGAGLSHDTLHIKLPCTSG